MDEFSWGRAFPTKVTLGRNKESDSLLKPRKQGTYRLPKLLLKESTIRGAGLGVFAEEAIPRKAPVTIYGGEIITEAEALALKRNNEHTHLQTLTRNFEHIDGRINYEKGYTHGYYLDNHYLGSFINDPTLGARDLNRLLNVKYEKFENPPLAEYTYAANRAHPDGQRSTTMIVIVAKRDIAEGEELFASYTSQYWQDFLDCAVCGGEHNLVCGDCLGVSYCSELCQKADWNKKHGEFCEVFNL